MGKIACRAGLDAGISALSDEWRQPPDLQFQADSDQQVSIPQLQQKAGLGFHKVGVLVTLGDGVNADLVSADLLRQRSKVTGSRDHVQLLGGGQCRGEQKKCRKREAEKSLVRL